METLSVKEYRDNLAASFIKADRGGVGIDLQKERNLCSREGGERGPHALPGAAGPYRRGNKGVQGRQMCYMCQQGGVEPIS